MTILDLQPSIHYLQQFFKSRYANYFEMMKDAGGSSRPPAFDREDEVIQGIRNIVHNIEDKFCDLSIPRGFTSPKSLVQALEWFGDMAANQLRETNDINDALGQPWYNVISSSVKINTEVKDAIDYALSLIPVSSSSKLAVANELAPREALLQMLQRLPQVAHELTNRRRDGNTPRATLIIRDEYDVQDLLRAVLAFRFDDVRPEEWCPSYAGSSKRMDFLLRNEKIVVEVKKTREGLGNKKLAEELTIDIANYRKHQDCKHLVCFIWDDLRKVSNPAGFVSDIESSNPGFVTVKIHQ